MPSDLHESIFDELETRITTLRSGAPAVGPDGGARTQQDVDAELEVLQSDQALLLEHWKVQGGVVVATAPARAQACGKPQSCPHVLGLAQKYGYV